MDEIEQRRTAMAETDKFLQVFREARGPLPDRPGPITRREAEMSALTKRLHEPFPIFFATIDAINEEIDGPTSEVRFVLRGRDPEVPNSPVSGQIVAMADERRFRLKVLTRGAGLHLKGPNGKPELFSPANDQKAADFLAKRLGVFFGAKGGIKANRAGARSGAQ
jgi:hypothetical protein